MSRGSGELQRALFGGGGDARVVPTHHLMRRGASMVTQHVIGFPALGMEECVFARVAPLSQNTVCNWELEGVLRRAASTVKVGAMQYCCHHVPQT
jgi:hypothetical protein